MEQSPSWEANSPSASQEISRILWNPNVHYRVHKSSPHIPILNQINLIYAPIPLLEDPFLILSSHLRLGLPSGLLPPGIPTKVMYAPLLSPIRATYLAHLILLDLITRMWFGEEYRSWSSSLCSLLRTPVTSSLLGRNILDKFFYTNFK